MELSDAYRSEWRRDRRKREDWREKRREEMRKVNEFGFIRQRGRDRNEKGMRDRA